MVQYPAVEWPIRSPLRERAKTTPERVAVRDPVRDSQLTFRELSHAVDNTAETLRERWNPAPGAGRPRIGFIHSPSLAFVTTLYAIWECGWTAVGLHTALTPGERQQTAATADVDAVVVGEEHEPGKAIGCRSLTASSVVDFTANSGKDQTTDDTSWGPDETALILFTSGTTAQPKGVRLTFRNLLSSATASAFRLGVSPDDRWLCCLPVSHMGGLAPVVRTVHYGTTLVVQRAFDATETAAILDTNRVTGVSLVPTQLKRLLDGGWTPPEGLETVLLGGAPATDDLLQRAIARGIPVYPTYGMTETASQIATARPADLDTAPGTVGQPLQGTSVTILVSGSPADPGERGEIVVDGPTVTPGYLDAEQTADAFGEFGFRTGDLGYRDERGRLWVVGRVDDVINTGGELVSPTEVTATLESQDSVTEAVAVGVDDEEWGQRVVALVVPRAGQQPAKTTLKSACRDQLAGYKVPKEIAFAESVPRTESGTVDRQAIRQRFTDQSS